MRLTLSLKASLAGAFGLLAVIAAGQGTVSIVKLTQIRHSVTEVGSNWIPSVVAVGQMRAAASEVRVKQLRLLSLSDTPAHLAENMDKLTASHDGLAKARRAYEPLIASKEERAIYETFSTEWSRFEQGDAEMRRLMTAGQQSAALKLMSSPETANLYDEARANLSRDVALNRPGIFGGSNS